MHVTTLNRRVANWNNLSDRRLPTLRIDKVPPANGDVSISSSMTTTALAPVRTVAAQAHGRPVAQWHVIIDFVHAAVLQKRFVA
jgi:hypothetical protein